MARSERNDASFHVRAATGNDRGKVSFSYYEHDHLVLSVLMPGFDARRVGELMVGSANEARDLLAEDLAKGLPPR